MTPRRDARGGASIAVRSLAGPGLRKTQPAYYPDFVPVEVIPAPRQGCHRLAGGRVLGAAGTTPPDLDSGNPLTPEG